MGADISRRFWARLRRLVESRRGLVACLPFVFAAYVLGINVVWLTSYTIPLIELSRSIYSGVFSIDMALCVYVDTVVINNRCFFAGPPGLPLLISPFIGFSRVHGNVLLLGGLAIAVSGLVAFVAAYELSRLIGSRSMALPAALIVGLAGPLWIYSTHIFPQAPLSASLACFVLLSIVAARERLGLLGYAAAGFAASLSVLLDPSIFITVLCIASILLAKMLRDLFSGVLTGSMLITGTILFLAGAAPPAIFLAIYNSSITGNPLDFPEFYLLEKLGIGDRGFVNPLPVGLYILLIDPRKGLIPLYPVLSLGIAAIPGLLKRLGVYEGVIYYSSLILPILVYSTWYDSDGGLSYGPRFAVPFTVLLAPAISLLLEKARSGAARLAIMAMTTYSIAENAIVVVTTPYPSSLEQLRPWENQFIHTSLPLLWSSTRSCYLYELLSRAGLDATTSTLLSISVLMILPLILISASLLDLQASLGKAIKVLKK